MAQWDDSENQSPADGGTAPAGNWWEGPRPANIPATAPWPPPLPPGASYGPNVGQIIYAPGTEPTGAQPQPGVDTPVTVNQPTYYPTAHDDPGVVTPPLPGPDTQPPPDIYHAPLTAPFPGTFTPPTPEGPATPPTFAPGTFTAPSVADALSDPGYIFRRDQGRDALQSWAAAKGTLNDSETGKALIDYGQGAGSQEYANVFGRALNVFNTNEADRFQGFGTDQQAWRDTRDLNNTNYQNAWTQFLNQQNEYDSWQDRVWGKVFGAATA